MDLFEEDSKKRLDDILGDSFELSDQQKIKIKSLEKELEDKKTNEEKNKERKEATSLDTGIPYSLVDMDVIKIATMVGMIKSKSVLEGKKKDTSMSLIDMLFCFGGNTQQSTSSIPFYYKPASKVVSDQVKMDYHSQYIQTECSKFTKLYVSHIQHHLAKIRKTTIMDIDKLTISSYIETCKSTMNMMMEFLEDETDKKEIDDLVCIISTIRNSLFGPMTIQDYIELVKTQVVSFKKFKVSKKIITKYLSWLDSMFTMYPGFHHHAPTEIDIKCIHQELEFRCHQNDPILKPFNMYHITRECCTPSLTCIDIEHMLTKCFIGPYHNNPVVYLPLDGSQWAFYVLKEIKNKTRLWVIDHSLVRTSDEVGTVLMAYMTQMFKTLHKAAFGDNNYRPGFLQKSAIGPLFKMLIKNMLVVNNKARFREFMAHLIINKSTIIATDNDLFNSQQNITYTDLLPSVATNEHRLIKSLFDDKSKYSITFLNKDMKN